MPSSTSIPVLQAFQITDPSGAKVATNAIEMKIFPAIFEPNALYNSGVLRFSSVLAGSSFVFRKLILDVVKTYGQTESDLPLTGARLHRTSQKTATLRVPVNKFKYIAKFAESFEYTIFDKAGEIVGSNFGMLGLEYFSAITASHYGAIIDFVNANKTGQIGAVGSRGAKYIQKVPETWTETTRETFFLDLLGLLRRVRYLLNRYVHWGIPTSLTKAFIQPEIIDELAFMDAKVGLDPGYYEQTNNLSARGIEILPELALGQNLQGLYTDEAIDLTKLLGVIQTLDAVITVSTAIRIWQKESDDGNQNYTMKGSFGSKVFSEIVKDGVTTGDYKGELAVIVPFDFA